MIVEVFVSERLRTIVKWLAVEAFVIALWYVGPVRGGVDPLTSMAMLFTMHAYPLVWALEWLVHQLRENN